MPRWLDDEESAHEPLRGPRSHTPIRRISLSSAGSKTCEKKLDVEALSRTDQTESTSTVNGENSRVDHAGSYRNPSISKVWLLPLLLRQITSLRARLKL